MKVIIRWNLKMNQTQWLSALEAVVLKSIKLSNHLKPFKPPQTNQKHLHEPNWAPDVKQSNQMPKLSFRSKYLSLNLQRKLQNRRNSIWSLKWSDQANWNLPYLEHPPERILNQLLKMIFLLGNVKRMRLKLTKLNDLATWL